MKKIGIIGDRHTYRRNENYYLAIEACGAEGVPLLIEKERVLPEGLDGLLLPGGVDVCPEFYGEENTKSVDCDKELDRFELAMIKGAVERKLPVLGICRGHQLINVYFGGSLIQDIENAAAHVWLDKDHDNAHASHVKQDSFLYEIYEGQSLVVNSAHHQALGRLGSGLACVQRSEDGVVEAIAHESLPVYGVQWHPERMCLKNRREDTIDGLPLFRWFCGRI